MAQVKTLCAFYDLAIGPTSFDVVPFLVQAEMARRRLGLDHLHLAIVPDREHYTRPKPAIYSAEEARWRLHQICLPAAALIGASVSLLPNWDFAQALAERADYRCWPEDWDRQTLKHRAHLIGGVIRAAQAGERVPTLSASAAARAAARALYAAHGGKPVVTLTLRSTYLPGRNSDVGVWQRVANVVKSQGYAVRLIGDTAHALADGKGFEEINLDLRMACYQEATLNLVANCGPASLCWFSDKSYRMFGAGDEHWDGLFVQQGLPLGASWPWASAQQRLVYGKETAESMLYEFATWKKEHDGLRG